MMLSAAALVAAGVHYAADNSLSAVSLAKKGEKYFEEGKPDKAVRYLERALDKDPRDVYSRFMLGKSLVWAREQDKGKAEFDRFQTEMDRIVDADPELANEYLSYLHQIAYLYYTSGRTNDAVRVYRKAIRLVPDDARAHYNLAYVYYRYLRRKELAYSELQDVINRGKDPKLADRARYFVDYMRNNPDPRLVEDFSFIEEK
jgi:tetratricopeptide (TPR) repeat protein